MSMNVEAEIRELKRRVSELEGSFGFLTRQVQTVHKDLLAFETKTEDKLKEHDRRFDKIDRDIQSLRDDIPKIVGDVMREVNAEKPRRKS
jgi:predicted  nucleic acid-binding Zn-ribbon protein